MTFSTKQIHTIYMINFQQNKFAPYIYGKLFQQNKFTLYMINFQQNKFAPNIYGKSFSSKTNLHIK